MTRSYAHKPSGAEVLGGLIVALFKVALVLGLLFLVDAFIGNLIGQLLHSFGTDTDFWTQFGLVVVPESIISAGVSSGVVAGAQQLKK